MRKRGGTEPSGHDHRHGPDRSAWSPTNACTCMIERRPKRILSIDYAPAADRHDRPGHPVCEPVWLEPYLDAKLGLEGPAGPDARYEEREGVELTFIPALGHRSHGQTRRRIRDDSQQCR